MNAASELIKLGANCIRIPVHPEPTKWGWISNFKEYLKTLKDLTAFIQATGTYYIIDWHYVSNWHGNKVAHTRRFWETILLEYRNNPWAIFEFFNEPVYPSDTKEFWKTYRKDIKELVYSCDNIVLLGSPNWSTRPHELYEFIGDIKDRNLGLTVHIYPNQSMFKIKRYEKVCKSIPVLVTEWGYGTEREKDINGNYSGGSSDEHKRKSWDEWGERVTRWMQESGVAGDMLWCYATSGWTPNTHILSHDGWTEFNMREALKRLQEEIL